VVGVKKYSIDFKSIATVKQTGKCFWSRFLAPLHWQVKDLENSRDGNRRTRKKEKLSKIADRKRWMEIQGVEHLRCR
jgi:hypothetical protein